MGVTLALRLNRPMVPSIHTRSPLEMPFSLAVSGLSSTTGSGSHSRNHGICRCSLWNNTGERRPVIMMSGYSLYSSGVVIGPCGVISL